MARESKAEKALRLANEAELQNALNAQTYFARLMLAFENMRELDFTLEVADGNFYANRPQRESDSFSMNQFEFTPEYSDESFRTLYEFEHALEYAKGLKEEEKRLAAVYANAKAKLKENFTAEELRMLGL